MKIKKLILIIKGCAESAAFFFMFLSLLTSNLILKMQDKTM